MDENFDNDDYRMMMRTRVMMIAMIMRTRRRGRVMRIMRTRMSSRTGCRTPSTSSRSSAMTPYLIIQHSFSS